MTDEERYITAGDLTLDTFRHEISGPHGKAMLTPVELKMMRFIMLHPDRWLSYADILWAVWGPAAEHMDSSVIRNHIAHIRKKIGKKAITSMRHHGYMLEVEDVDAHVG